MERVLGLRDLFAGKMGVWLAFKVGILVFFSVIAMICEKDPDYDG